METCDFGLLQRHDTETVLRSALPDRWQRYLESAAARRLIAELGVETRHLTHLPGRAADPARLTALDLARSAVLRMRDRHPRDVERLDAIIFASTSNPHPCNSQAALLAGELGLRGSCLDLKAGCSSGVLAVMQAALLIQAGCARVLVIAAENLSQFTPPDDIRMLLTVGDGAACMLVERCEGPGFLSVIHGSDPTFARAMTVWPAFPPAQPSALYAYAFENAGPAAAALRERWQGLLAESLSAAGLDRRDLGHCFVHQSHAAQFDDVRRQMDQQLTRVPDVVRTHGNMGTPTFAVAMAQSFAALHPGQRYLIQAVGGGMSWCSIVAEHC